MSDADQTQLDRILTTAASYRASDLHLVSGAQPTVRLDGQLVALEQEPIVTAELMQLAVDHWLSPEQRQKLNTDRELVAAVNPRPDLRCKLMAFYQRQALSMTIHFIGTTVKKLADLGLPEAVGQLADLSKGLILITGPYGSGRSATLNALVNEINQRRTANIVTIEKPVEYIYANLKSIIEQREVGTDAVSFEQAISSASKDDVDVIVVSEAETSSVIRALLNAAEAGRLVISTLSSESVLTTVDSILNSVPAEDMPKIRRQLATTLAAIISQHLLPRIGGGLVLAADVLIPNAPIRSVMRDGALAQLNNTIQTSRTAGVVSFDRRLIQLIEEGQITQETAESVAQDQAVVRNAHKR